MIFLGPFALSSAPFSWTRFTLFMAGLAAISVVSIAGDRRAASHNHDERAPALAGSDDVDIVAFCQPVEDLHDDLRQIGIPWFLRRQGATSRFDSQGKTDINIEVGYKGEPVGNYVEHLVTLDADRSKLQVAFIPKNHGLVGLLAKPIDTKLDPISLMRVTMAEHVRSAAKQDGFDFNVLTETPDSYKAKFRKAFRASVRGESQDGDNISCPSENANIRRAYREEAARAGADAHKL
jgi:hypothetical protein